ncbi:MAG: substrate-binding domain-containing protein [Planctomycetes bacterium]|nr:substrate-binding domain-containing protein [Planctomycetota bacterium]
MFGLLLACCGCAGVRAAPRIDLVLGGAQIPLELVESWLNEARAYRFVVEQAKPVFLSQHGFENLAKHACDIACTDRPLAENELAQFGDQPPRGYRVAFFGFALYVHPSNPLDSIFAKHIRYLFRREITDWKQLVAEPVAGLEGPIRLYGPRKASRGGMILMRQSKIWFVDPSWEPLETDQEIIDAVAADPLALGFASIGHDGPARYLGLRMKRTAAPAFPSLEEIESQRYGLAKVIYVYLPTERTPETDAVLEYLFSARGRSEIEATDAWPIPWGRAALATER